MILFETSAHQVATGTAPQDLLAVYKASSPYLVQLIRFWVMCSDPAYPAGAMLDIELLRLGLATVGSGGTTAAGKMQQDNSLGLSPVSVCHQNDTGLATTGTTTEVIWAGSCQIWQGVDVIMSGEPTLANYSAGGPTYDAFVLRLATALATSVKLSCGLIFGERY